MRRAYKQAAKCLDFHTSNKVATAVLVYRDSEWIRLPSCLLAEGDIISLLEVELKLHTHLEFVEPEVKIRSMLQSEGKASAPRSRAAMGNSGAPSQVQSSAATPVPQSSLSIQHDGTMACTLPLSSCYPPSCLSMCV